jgi:hypothetical protein
MVFDISVQRVSEETIFDIDSTNCETYVDQYDF